MKKPFPKSISFTRKYYRLLEMVNASDTLGILINADPDSMASAMALKRIFWKKAKSVLVYRVNSIKRADNLAFVNLLTVEQKLIHNDRVSQGRQNQAFPETGNRPLLRN